MPPFKNKIWRDVVECPPPKDGSFFLARIKGTSRATSVSWSEACQAWIANPYGPVEIDQWTTFAEFGQVRQCVWNGSTK